MLFGSCWQLHKGNFLTINDFMNPACFYLYAVLLSWYKGPEIPCSTRNVCPVLCVTLPSELGSAGFYDIMHNTRKEW